MNGKVAKASTAVKPGDVLEIAFGNRTVKAEILEVAEDVRKEQAQEMYRFI